jgi:hypothetical protein
MAVLVPADAEVENKYDYNGGLGSISLSGFGIERRDHIINMVMDDLIIDEEGDFPSRGTSLSTDRGRKVLEG